VSPDGRRLFTFGDDGVLRAIDSDDGRVLAEYNTMLKGATVCAAVGLSLSADGERLLTAASYPNAVAPQFPFVLGLYETTSLSRVATFEAQEVIDRFGCAGMSPDGRVVVGTAPADHPHPQVAGMELLHMEGATLKGRAFVPINMPDDDYPQGSQLDFSADSRLAIVPGPGDRLLVLDTGTWRIEREMRIRGSPRRPVWWREPGKSGGARELLAAATTESSVCLIDPFTWRTVREFDSRTGNVTALAFSTDGARLVTGSTDGTIRVWETATGIECAMLRGHEGYVRGLAFSPDGATLYSCSEDGTVRAWRTDGVKTR